MTKIIGVRFREVGKIYYFSPGTLDIKVGDKVIVETSRGLEYGNVVLGVREQLVKDTATRPFNSKYKIYIIDEANKLTKEAQNAILKTIEEPPSYVIIILLSDNMEVFLDTIKSRCVKLNMEYIKDDAILKYLKNKYSIDDDFLYSLATYARGNIGKAIDISRKIFKFSIYNSLFSGFS